MNLGQRIFTTVCRRVVVLARELGPADAALPEVRPGLRVVRLGTEQLAAYAVLRGEAAATVAARRLEEGQLCWVVFREEALAYTRWAALGRVHVPYLRRDLLLSEGDAYIHDVFCDPLQRRLGMARQTALQASAELWARGIRRQLAVVALENELGMGLGLGLGWQPIGRLGCLRLGPLQLDLPPQGAPPPVLRPDQAIRSQSGRS